MIKIAITRVTTEKYTVNENLLTKETPTDKVQMKDYGNVSEVMMAKEYAVAEVSKHSTVTLTLLEQEIAEDSAFNLPAVIKAINNIE